MFSLTDLLVGLWYDAIYSFSINVKRVNTGRVCPRSIRDGVMGKGRSLKWVDIDMMVNGNQTCTAKVGYSVNMGYDTKIGYAVKIWYSVKIG